ncbi:MAG TPA: transcriptional regulator, partial [Porphyromonadaceae bacterium]|nr:transcriptional regulator [Porphyromonadaceae bacterium]
MKKRIRIKDIAAQAGVSSGTVDRILHNRGNVSDKARIAVEKVLKQVGYKPNIHLSGLSLKKTYEIVITTPHASHGEYWESIHNGIQEAIDQHESLHIKTTYLTYDQYNIYSCQNVFTQILILEPDAVIIGPTFKDETIAL